MPGVLASAAALMAAAAFSLAARAGLEIVPPFLAISGRLIQGIGALLRRVDRVQGLVLSLPGVLGSQLAAPPALPLARAHSRPRLGHRAPLSW